METLPGWIKVQIVAELLLEADVLLWFREALMVRELSEHYRKQGHTRFWSAAMALTGWDRRRPRYNIYVIFAAMAIGFYLGWLIKL
jgi:hypothetical protein